VRTSQWRKSQKIRVADWLGAEAVSHLIGSWQALQSNWKLVAANPRTQRTGHQVSMLRLLDKSSLRAFAAEFMCTYIFIFAICANALNELRTKVSTSMVSSGVSTAFVAVAIIYAFGGLSGAHFNPAVTIGAMVGGKIDPAKGLVYIVLQLVAALGAVGTLGFLFPEKVDVLVIHPGEGASSLTAVVFEFILAFILVFVIYATAMGVKTSHHGMDVESAEEDDELIAQNKHRIHFAPIAIGFTLGFLCFLAGTISGGAFNPARATAPAIIAMDFTGLWVYWVGDVSGAIVAALTYKVLFA
jgi:aquaporin related protein